jgi:hypothetical protein
MANLEEDSNNWLLKAITMPEKSGIFRGRRHICGLRLAPIQRI